MALTISYTLSDTEEAKLKVWLSMRPKHKEGVSGGRYTYMITPTSIGDAIRIRDCCTKEEYDLTDYESW